MVQTKCEFINNMLFYPALEIYPEKPKNFWNLSFCVHSTIMEKWKNILLKLPIKLDTESDIFEHNLRIGETCFDMRIIHARPQNRQNRYNLDIIIENSQVSFPWEENPTLFINKKSFPILQKFIANHKLEVYTIKIEEITGITANNDTITVVTFNRSVNESDIIDNYKTYLKSFETYRPPLYYYMTHVFLWHQPYMLNHFELPIQDEFHSLILIILNHLGTLKYVNELNIFDWLMIRLAICDYRNPSISRIIKYEIDFIIKRELRKNIKNNNLDLEGYMIANNCTQREVVYGYLIYEFQNYFETITNNKVGALNGKKYSLKARTLNSVIYLANETNVLNTLKQKFNIEFDIDGRNYNQMSLSLFLDLVECRNVRQIYLDTNYRWLQNTCNLNRSISKLTIIVNLLGSNTYNFVEDFVSSLKNIPRSKRFWLKINSTLNDYRIFDHLNINNLEFVSIQINAQMLVGLHKCKLKSKVNFLECTFENTIHCWALLNNLRKLRDSRILEDQDTWQPLFEFIWNKLLNSTSKEFRFNANQHLVIISSGTQIQLKDIFFTIDGMNTKLEIRNKMDNQPIDLYDLKFNLQSDNKSDYEFYQ